MSWLKVVLVSLAVYRLTVLVTRDEITKWWREGLQRRYTGSFVEFWFCPWCVSVWLGAGAVLLAIYQWGWWQWVCLAFVASGVAGFLAEHS